MRVISKDLSVLLIVTTLLLFSGAIGYNKLRVENSLTEKKVFPSGIPYLVEHNKSQGEYALTTVGLDSYMAMVLGAKSEKISADTRIQILNGTSVQGLAAAVSRLFEEEGFSSVVVGNAPEKEYNTTQIKFRPGMGEEAKIVENLIGENLNTQLVEFTESTSAMPERNFDIVVILNANSPLFEQYFSEIKQTTFDKEIVPTETVGNNIIVRVLNGGAPLGAARMFEDVLENNGFDNISVGDADNFDYETSIIKYGPETEDIANHIEQLLNQSKEGIDKELVIDLGDEIVVILGSGRVGVFIGL